MGGDVFEEADGQSYAVNGGITSESLQPRASASIAATTIAAYRSHSNAANCPYKSPQMSTHNWCTWSSGQGELVKKVGVTGV